MHESQFTVSQQLLLCSKVLEKVLLHSRSGVAKLRPAGRIRPVNQINPARQLPCTFFQAPRFRLWTAVKHNWILLRAVANGGASGARPPRLKSVPPHFTFGPLVAAYIQHSIFKMWPLLLVFGPSFWFLAPLLLNSGNGPAAACLLLTCLPQQHIAASSSIKV